MTPNEKFYYETLPNPKQTYGKYKYPDGSVSVGLITDQIRQQAREGKLTILEEHTR